jgi:hypothetical protein
MVMRLALLIVCAATLAHGEISGHWSGKLHVARPQNFHLELSNTGEQLIGYGGLRPDFLTELDHPRLTGATLTFSMRMPMGPRARFEATLQDDRLTGTAEFPGSKERPKFELTRTGPLTRLPASFDPAPPAGDLAPLSDEFNSPESLAQWKSVSLEESLPNRIARADVNKTNLGHLFIEPNSGAWWAGFHGGFLYKEVTGDFSITTRIKVTGKSGGEPENIWTISGLLIRAPADLRMPLPLRKENWVYLMTGRGPQQARVIDSKSTVDSINEWDILPAESGYYELRMVRLGPLFVSLVRADGGAWTVRKRMLRNDLPATVQAGINFTSDYKNSATMPAAEYNARLYPEKSNPDSHTVVDYVRFARPPAEARSMVAGKALIDLSDEQLLKVLR